MSWMLGLNGEERFSRDGDFECSVVLPSWGPAPEGLKTCVLKLQASSYPFSNPLWSWEERVWSFRDYITFRPVHN